MIDINELRRLAQAATPGPWYIGSGTYEGRNIYSAKAVTDDEGFTYNPVVATAEDDGAVCWDANARLIAAANPAAISKLLDRLEAAEKDIALKERVIDAFWSELAAVAKEHDALRAKVEAMERQKPVAFALYSGWALKATYLKEHEACEQRDRRQLTADLGGSLEAYRVEPLYALPGAKGE